jgi:hypothetical protein
MNKQQLICTTSYDIRQVMGIPAKLTERQIKFAELLVFNEGRKTKTECAMEAGYDTRPRQAAHELTNPKISPLVVKYIGELREEMQKKHEVTFERHISELAKLRDESKASGSWSAAINAEVARGKAAGLYIDQKVIKYGTLDSLTPAEIEAKMKQILEDHKGLLVEADFETVTPEQEKQVDKSAIEE